MAKQWKILDLIPLSLKEEMMKELRDKIEEEDKEKAAKELEKKMKSQLNDQPKTGKNNDVIENQLIKEALK